MARTKQTAIRSSPRRHRRSTPSATEAPAATADPPDPNTPGPSSAAEAQPRQRKPRKPYRRKPGVKALQDIRKYQKSFELLIPAAPFIRVVREISNAFSRDGCRWTPEALLALQEAAEDYLIHMFEDAMLCAIHARRVTLKHLLDVSCFKFQQDNLKVAKRLVACTKNRGERAAMVRELKRLKTITNRQSTT